LAASQGGSARAARARPDQIAGAALAALGAFVAWASREYPFGTVAEPGPGFLPFALALVLAAFGAVLVLSGSVARAARGVSFSDLPHVMLVLAVLSGAAFGIERIGYRAVVALMLVFFLVVIERRNAIGAFLLAAAMAFGSFYLINNVLRVPLPVGPWGI
jgi:putative tricarboxylic transport membrane protein